MTETVLYTAIAGLFVALSTVAKVTWSERGKRVESAEALTDYYREELPKLLNRIVDAQVRQEESINRLADGLEKAIHYISERT